MPKGTCVLSLNIQFRSIVLRNFCALVEFGLQCMSKKKKKKKLYYNKKVLVCYGGWERTCIFFFFLFSRLFTSVFLTFYFRFPDFLLPFSRLLLHFVKKFCFIFPDFFCFFSFSRLFTSVFPTFHFRFADFLLPFSGKSRENRSEKSGKQKIAEKSQENEKSGK